PTQTALVPSPVAPPEGDVVCGLGDHRHGRNADSGVGELRPPYGARRNRPTALTRGNRPPGSPAKLHPPAAGTGRAGRQPHPTATARRGSRGWYDCPRRVPAAVRADSRRRTP